MRESKSPSPGWQLKMFASNVDGLESRASSGTDAFTSAGGKRGKKTETERKKKGVNIDWEKKD